MVQKQYGHLLFDAIRETLENMAFAEVVPQSMIIGQQEFIDEIRKNSQKTAPQENCNADSRGTSFTTNGAKSISDNGNLENVPSANATGSLPASAWEKPLDSWWRNASLFSEPEESQYVANQGDADFDILAKKQQDWCWSCLKVNSPELNSVWFVIPQNLLKELAKTMLAGERSLNVDTVLMRDIIAELTNVIGGRLMLLLEELIGQFTLEVPVTGVGIPDFDDKNTVNETVICKVLVDGAYPVLSTMSFHNDISLLNRSENIVPNMIQK